MAKVANVPTVTLKLRLPENIYDTLSERAAKFGRDVEDEIVFRLRDTLSYTASQPIYLDDNARNALSQLAGRMIRTPDDVLQWAKTVSTINVAGTSVSLSETLLKRLKSRCFGRTTPELIEHLVTENLEREVGMR